MSLFSTNNSPYITQSEALSLPISKIPVEFFKDSHTLGSFQSNKPINSASQSYFKNNRFYNTESCSVLEYQIKELSEIILKIPATMDYKNSRQDYRTLLTKKQNQYNTSCKQDLSSYKNEETPQYSDNLTTISENNLSQGTPQQEIFPTMQKNTLLFGGLVIVSLIGVYILLKK